jgi:uncharacterized OB-fold protein
MPLADEISEPFWESARQGRLMIQRCMDCRRYYYPPTEFCWDCLAGHLTYEQVSGKGRVYSYTETVSGARHPYFVAHTPYLVGAVELDEQEELVLHTNFPSAELESLTVGAPVEVEFEAITPDCSIPQFRLVNGTNTGMTPG